MHAEKRKHNPVNDDDLSVPHFQFFLSSVSPEARESFPPSLLQVSRHRVVHGFGGKEKIEDDDEQGDLQVNRKGDGEVGKLLAVPLEIPRGMKGRRIEMVGDLSPPYSR